jgi:tetratricopeptide (TPR) repeat protein
MVLKTDALRCVAGVIALTVLALSAEALAEQEALAGQATLAGQAARDEQTTADGEEEVFRHAFTQEMTPAERVQALERLVKEHSDSKWADDALWVLGEAARQQGLSQRVVYYWQYLTGSKPDMELEQFTKSQDLYRRSGLAEVTYYLQATGFGYVPQEGLAAKDGTYFVNAKPVNPAPMLVWGGLAHAYEDLGQPRLALKAYRKALECAPAAGPWTRSYQDRVERLDAGLRSQDDGSSAGNARQTAPSGSVEVVPSAEAREAKAAAPTSAADQATRAPAQDARASGAAPASGRTGGD